MRACLPLGDKCQLPHITFFAFTVGNSIIFLLILSDCIDIVVICKLTASLSTSALQANLIFGEKKVTRRLAIELCNPPQA